MPAPGDLRRLFDLAAEPWFEPRYNIAPTQQVAIVRGAAADRRLDLVRWGLIPSWSREGPKGHLLINARSETAAEKPAFRSALQSRRCLIPMTGFYEWGQSAKGKEPNFFLRPSGGLLAMAGLWERWTGPDGVEVESCCILTVEAAPPVSLVHDRMPAILKRDDHGVWLDSGFTDSALIQSMLKPAPAGTLMGRAVSARVNSVRNQGPDLIAPL